MPDSVAEDSVAGSAAAYFGPREGQLWRWASDAQAVEWASTEQKTICLREELAQLLAGLQADGLPPLAPLLLVLAACAGSWPGVLTAEMLLLSASDNAHPQPNDPAPELLTQAIQQALAFVYLVNKLPANLRTGPTKRHLLREVFAAQAPQVPPGQAQAVLDEWTSSRLEARLLAAPAPGFTRRQLLHELTLLADALARFPTPEDLARQLRTGRTAPPTPLPDLLPLLAAAEQHAATGPAAAPNPTTPAPANSLLEQLADDPRTAGLARLARQLQASLHVPARSEAAGELPLGGVADLSTRGSLDRLLLSELAHDDLTLLARLANHEALYWRREEPPRPAAPTQVLLLDTTLRLWGTPRVFGLAAALAWGQQALGQRPAPTAFALGGQHATPLNLRTPAGVLESLTYLDPAPHAGAALQALTAQPPASPAVEYVLITAAELLGAGSDFGRQLAATTLPLRFVLALGRDGTLEVYELVNGHRVVRGSSQHDLPALLGPAPAPRRPHRPKADPPADLPAFWQQPVAPLFLPLVGLRANAKNSLLTERDKRLGLLGVTDNRRLLHLPGSSTGAREVLPVVASGHYFFSTDHATYLAVLVLGPGGMQVHVLPAGATEASTTDLSAELRVPPEKMRIWYHRTGFFIEQGPNWLRLFDCQRLRLDAVPELWPTTPEALPAFDPAAAQRYLRHGYNVLLRVRQVAVSEAGELLLDSFVLQAPTGSSGSLWWVRKSSRQPVRAVAAGAGSVPGSANPQVQLLRRRWADGSECVLDSRGLLHLRSTDPALPEVTLLLTLNWAVAAWAADGSVCGPPYSVGPHPAQPLDALAFYSAYIQPFLDRLA